LWKNNFLLLSNMKIIVGLGNPGKKYQNTRHNIGFAMLDFLFDQWLSQENFSAWQDKKKFKAEISQGRLNREKIILIKPQTMMNNSGQSVQAVLDFFQARPQDLVVIHDDLDLTLGKYKIQTNRSAAGHNGVKSIIRHLQTQDFTRIRIGIGQEKNQGQTDTVNFVLNKFGLLEKNKLKKLKKQILQEIKSLLS